MAIWGTPLRLPKRIRASRSKQQRVEALYGYAFLTPLLLGYAAFILGPVLFGFGISFTDWPILGDARWIGLGNYREIFLQDPLFWMTMKNTLYFSAGLVPLNIAMALGLAMLLERSVRGVGLFRTAYFTPVVTSIVAWGILWKFIFATEAGLINILLRYFGIEGPAWLYDETLAMPVVIVTSVLKNVGLNMVIFLAALRQVPRMYYEAAVVDGAKRWASFRHITLPMITPSVFLTLVITIIGSLKVFAQIQVMTGGGPGTSTYVLVYYVWQKAFRTFEFGYASALAYILFVLVFIFTLVQWNLRKRWVFHER